MCSQLQFVESSCVKAAVTDTHELTMEGHHKVVTFSLKVIWQVFIENILLNVEIPQNTELKARLLANK